MNDWKKTGGIAALALAVGAGGFAIGLSDILRHGKSIADDALEAAEQGFCNLPSEGSVWRRYGPHPERKAAREEFCKFIWNDMIEGNR